MSVPGHQDPGPGVGLMIQGTSSDAGKSLMVAALGRILHRRGVRVAPFKPQNMALNSAVTVDDGEIGRAQALQAIACGVPAHSDMNPVLLKPVTDQGAQVIVNGRAVGNMTASAFHAFKPQALQAVVAAYQRLLSAHDVVLVEGAGSPAEINLRDGDIANMGFAEAADCPVVLVGDIDRGGVFAHLVGTLACLSDSERERIAGFIINRFRGDPALLDDGLSWLQRETGKPVLGVVPFVAGLQLEEEDAIRTHGTAPEVSAPLRVVVPVLPRISNHTDLDPLRWHPGVQLEWIGPGQPIPPADLIVLPGSKSVRADCDWLLSEGWDTAIMRHLRYGGHVLGICGGLQMLGHALHDPDGVEGTAGSTRGLALLDLETTLAPEKTLVNTRGTLTALPGAAPFSAYEIHCGQSSGPALDQPLAVTEEGRADGAVSDDGLIIGTYQHGLLDEAPALSALLAWAGLERGTDFDAMDDQGTRREAALERLADVVEAALDWSFLDTLLAGQARTTSGETSC